MTEKSMQPQRRFREPVLVEAGTTQPQKILPELYGEIPHGKVADTGVRPLSRRRIMCASGITEFFCPGHTGFFYFFALFAIFYYTNSLHKPNHFILFKVF